jgi:hypothetical protein
LIIFSSGVVVEMEPGRRTGKDFEPYHELMNDWINDERQGHSNP